MTLAEDFQNQLERNIELRVEYRSLPNNAGAFGALMLTNVIDKAKHALATGDVVAMLRSYEEMKGSKG